MFRSDLIFPIILAVLLVLPFLSVSQEFKTFPYDLLFSALGAISVVILAWDRIADRRSERLKNLMRRVCLDDGEFKLFRTLRFISGAVEENGPLFQQELDSISGAAAILSLAGRYHRIDYLYPKKIAVELLSLLQSLLDYDREWLDIEDQVEASATDKPWLKRLVYGLLRGEFILKENERGLFLPYIAHNRARAEAFPTLNHDEGQRLRDFVKVIQTKQAENEGILSPDKRTEIIYRIGTILGEFGLFLEKNGIPAPSTGPEKEPGRR